MEGNLNSFRLFKFDMSISPPSTDVEKAAECILGFWRHIQPGEINMSHQHISGVFKQDFMKLLREQGYIKGLRTKFI